MNSEFLSSNHAWARCGISVHQRALTQPVLFTLIKFKLMQCLGGAGGRESQSSRKHDSWETKMTTVFSHSSSLVSSWHWRGQVA
jgi:hypothetical protein